MNRNAFIDANVKLPKLAWDIDFSKKDIHKEVLLHSIWEITQETIELMPGRFEVAEDIGDRVGMRRIDGNPATKIMGAAAIFEREMVPYIFYHVIDEPTTPPTMIIHDGLGRMDNNGNPVDGWKWHHWIDFPILRYNAWKRERSGHQNTQTSPKDHPPQV